MQDGKHPKSEVMKENKNTTCDPCERDFQKSVDELVKEGKAPSHAERKEKEHEVNAAFSQQHAAGHSGRQCASQHPTGSHSDAEQGAREGSAEHMSGQRSGMDSLSGNGSGLSSNEAHSGQRSGMDSPQGARSGERPEMGEYPGSENEKQKTHESSDAAVHAMAGSTSDLK